METTTSVSNSISNVGNSISSTTNPKVTTVATLNGMCMYLCMYV